MIRRVLLIMSLLAASLVLVVAGSAWWAWRQQTGLVIASANELLAAYGVEVLSIHGLTTGLQSSHADRVVFRLGSINGEHTINGLRLDYDVRQLVQGHVQRLQADSIELRPQHVWLTEKALIDFHTLDIQCKDIDQCTGNLSLQAAFDQIDIPEHMLAAQQLTMQARVDFRYDAPLARIDLLPGLTAALGSANSETTSVEQLGLTMQQTLRLNVDLDERLMVADGGQLMASIPVIRHLPMNTEDTGGLSGFEATLQRLNGSFDFSEAPATTQTRSWQQRLSVAASFGVEKIYTSLVPLNLWSSRWQQTLTWTPQQVLQLSSSIWLASREILTINITQDFGSRHGRANVLSNNLDFSPGNLTLTDLVSPLPVDADLIAGELDLQAEFGWQIPLMLANSALPDWQIHGAITTGATALTGFYEDTAFTGLTTSAHWQLEPDMTLVTREPALLQLAEANPGIALRDIETRYYYNHRAQQLTLGNTRLNLFGGTVTAAPLTLNLAGQTDGIPFHSEFIIQIDGVDISQMLSLSAYNQVTASGLVDGTLPVTLKGLTPVISGGTLAARAPGGSIRYDAGTTVSGNQSLDLVYQALRHYQYELMSATVDYLDTGELILAMQLQGLSPELNSGQRINLNLNISDNIPALLQSLQAAQNMNDRLQELLE